MAEVLADARQDEARAFHRAQTAPYRVDPDEGGSDKWSVQEQEQRDAHVPEFAPTTVRR